MDTCSGQHSAACAQQCPPGTCVLEAAPKSPRSRTTRGANIRVCLLLQLSKDVWTAFFRAVLCNAVPFYLATLCLFVAIDLCSSLHLFSSQGPPSFSCLGIHLVASPRKCAVAHSAQGMKGWLSPWAGYVTS